jgi:hypothetical protein
VRRSFVVAQPNGTSSRYCRPSCIVAKYKLPRSRRTAIAELEDLVGEVEGD